LTIIYFYFVVILVSLPISVSRDPHPNENILEAASSAIEETEKTDDHGEISESENHSSGRGFLGRLLPIKWRKHKNT
jgi:hypothetical protein